MKKIPVKPIKRQSENTISLINIVFLMLIFFLIAGQLAPPMDSEVELIDTTEADPLPPPDALVAREDGALFFQNEPVTAEAHLAYLNAESETPVITDDETAPKPAGPVVRLIADKNLSAIKLIDLVSELQKAGAGKVTIVTQRGN